jgi:hypothetical protein
MKLTPTLVCIGPGQIGDRQFHHGEELPDGSLAQDEIDKMIDQKMLMEVPQRRSLYRLFAPFTGAKEREPLDAELTPFAL